MRLLSITLANVRRFDARVRVEGLGAGLNVLAAPNESGKSTIFDAVQALFFVPHRSQAREVRALRPHAGGAPEVAVEVETAEGRFDIAKRWLSRPEARVCQAGRLVAQADEAEAWIARLVGGGEGGPAGLLWVRQGMTALDQGSEREQAGALEARRTLLSSVTGEVEAMTGGRRMDAALARCRAELERYATATGRPRTGGPWKEAADAVEALSGERERLAAVAAELAAALDRRRAVRVELTRLEDPREVRLRASRLAEARAAADAAERHAEAVAGAEAAVMLAALRLSGAEADLARLREARRERGLAAAAEAQAAEVEAGAARALAAAEERLAPAEAAAEGAAADLAVAQTALRAALRRAAAQDGARRRAELAAQIARAEVARSACEAAAAAAQAGPSAGTLHALETLAQEVEAAGRLRDAAAAQVTMTYAAGVADAVRLGDRPLAHGVGVPIPEGAALDIAGVGRLTIRPGRAGSDASVEALSERLAAALASAGAADLAGARRAAAARQQAEREAGEARAALAALAPAGIDALRSALAAIPEAGADDDVPDPEAAQAALAVAEAAAAAARSTADAARREAEAARAALAGAAAAAVAARARLDRARAARDDRDEAALAEGLAHLRAARAAAEAGHRALCDAAPDLEAARAALERARSVAGEAERRLRELAAERAVLDERIEVRSGEAVEEDLADVAERLAAAAGRLAGIEAEVRALTRLRDALDAARRDARERYFEPVMRELAPLLRLLWPDAELRFDERTLLPVSLSRAGREEEIDILSGGTREQVALLVRLAFARMLAAGGRHAPVILDDALVFTDDDRIERMFDALHRQASGQQIIVLSCRQRAFADLGGRTLRLAPATVAA